MYAVEDNRKQAITDYRKALEFSSGNFPAASVG
jgi:hypothetical protein